jgi:hypothetical protein
VLYGLGCRIGELLALDWTKVDEKAGTLAIEGTVIRIPGKGLTVQKHTKSAAGMRTITAEDVGAPLRCKRSWARPGDGARLLLRRVASHLWRRYPTPLGSVWWTLRRRTRRWWENHVVHLGRIAVALIVNEVDEVRSGRRAGRWPGTQGVLPGTSSLS